MLDRDMTVLTPSTLDEALKMRAAHPTYRPLAGGTDLMVALELGAIKVEGLISLWGIESLKTIEAVDGGVWIGACCTYTDLINDGRAPALLVEASKTVGAKQIQNRGTLGGNIANASPAGDTLPVLMVLDAEVEVVSAARGARRIPMEALYLGYRSLDMAADELITRVFLPAAKRGVHTCYRKVGTRQAQSISKVSFAARVQVLYGIVREVRIAYGSVAATPVRCPTVEAALLGKPVDPRVAEQVLEDICPIDDIRATAAYRRRVSVAILRGWLGSLGHGHVDTRGRCR